MKSNRGNNFEGAYSPLAARRRLAGIYYNNIPRQPSRAYAVLASENEMKPPALGSFQCVMSVRRCALYRARKYADAQRNAGIVHPIVNYVGRAVKSVSEFV